MNDSLREFLSYGGLGVKILKFKKTITPQKICYGTHKNQYFLHFTPKEIKSDKIVIWIHGGGWNSGTPNDFHFIGETIAREGYHCISIGYRLSPKNKYPSQIEDVSNAFNSCVKYLKENNISTERLIVTGPSAGAHLGSILCYSKSIQNKYNVNVSNVIGFIGSGGPYDLTKNPSSFLSALLKQLFTKNYNLLDAEPCSLICESKVPMLLIQSKHDGVINYSSVEMFKEKADCLLIPCEVYTVEDKHNTHSWYTTGLFLETRQNNKALDKFFDWIEQL